MTATFFLVRHGTHPLLGKVLAGRMADVHLDSHGQQQADRLGERLAVEHIELIVSSPLARACETAMPLAQRTGLALETRDDVNEVDCGAWTGAALADLARDPRWTAWNTARSVSRAPGGETMLEVQARAVAGLEALREARPEGRIAIFSHADVIRAVLLYHLGLSVDRYDTLTVEPGSISILAVGGWGAKLLRLNDMVAA